MSIKWVLEKRGVTWPSRSSNLVKMRPRDIMSRLFGGDAAWMLMK